MSLIKSTVGLVAAGTAVAAHKTAKNTWEDDPVLSAGAAIVTAVAAGAAVYTLVEEIGEIRRAWKALNGR